LVRLADAFACHRDVPGVQLIWPSGVGSAEPLQIAHTAHATFRDIRHRLRWIVTPLEPTLDVSSPENR